VGPEVGTLNPVGSEVGILNPVGSEVGTLNPVGPDDDIVDLLALCGLHPGLVDGTLDPVGPEDGALDPVGPEDSALDPVDPEDGIPDPLCPEGGILDSEDGILDSVGDILDPVSFECNRFDWAHPVGPDECSLGSVGSEGGVNLSWDPSNLVRRRVTERGDCVAGSGGESRAELQVRRMVGQIADVNFSNLLCVNANLKPFWLD